CILIINSSDVVSDRGFRMFPAPLFGYQRWTLQTSATRTSREGGGPNLTFRRADNRFATPRGDEAWRREARRTELGTRQQSPQAPRRRSAPRSRSVMSNGGGTGEAPAAPDPCVGVADSALATFPNAPCSTCATSAPRPRSFCRSPGCKAVLPDDPPRPGESGA